MIKSRNAELLAEFTAYCKAHPEERFWQALRNWSGAAYIIWQRVSRWADGRDTFYWEGKDE